MNSQFLLDLATDLDQLGDYRSANLIDYCIFKKGGVTYQSPQNLADSLYRIINHLVQRTSIEKQPNYIQNIRNRLSKLNPMEIAGKNPNPSSAIGATINIVKNVLIGQPMSVIVDVISALQRTI